MIQAKPLWQEQKFVGLEITSTHGKAHEMDLLRHCYLHRQYHFVRTADIFGPDRTRGCIYLKQDPYLPTGDGAQARVTVIPDDIDPSVFSIIKRFQGLLQTETVVVKQVPGIRRVIGIRAELFGAFEDKPEESHAHDVVHRRYHKAGWRRHHEDRKRRELGEQAAIAIDLEAEE
jgi:hypothetical protein